MSIIKKVGATERAIEALKEVRRQIDLQIQELYAQLPQPKAKKRKRKPVKFKVAGKMREL